MHLWLFLGSWKWSDLQRQQQHLSCLPMNGLCHTDSGMYNIIKFIFQTHNTGTGTFYSTPEAINVKCVYMLTVL